MICPNCSEMLNERQLLKFNVRYMPGSSNPIEYEATCPFCRTEIGNMSWGQFTPLPKYQNIKTDETKETDENNKEETDTEEAGNDVSENSPPPKICPHCGGELPADF